ncbi:MAG: DUF5667 domain-containing protein [bacterium]|nr:DUF5667 domain-containing protein [bacterium]
MEKLINKIKLAKQRVGGLSAETKRAGKTELIRFMKITGDAQRSANTDVRVAAIDRHRMYRSPLQTLLIKPMPIILAIALLFSGGVSAAAQNTQPGDLLYPVKVGVNEEVRAALSLSTKAKAKWEAHRAEERLEEAAELEAEGRMDAETRAELEERFDMHIQRLREFIDRLEAQGRIESAAEVTAEFEAMLEAALNADGDTDVDVEIEVEDTAIRQRVNNTLQTISNLGNKLELKIKIENENEAEAEVKAKDKDKEDKNRDNDDDEATSTDDDADVDDDEDEDRSRSNSGKNDDKDDDNDRSGNGSDDEDEDDDEVEIEAEIEVEADDDGASGSGSGNVNLNL